MVLDLSVGIKRENTDCPPTAPYFLRSTTKAAYVNFAPFISWKSMKGSGILDPTLLDIGGSPDNVFSVDDFQDLEGESQRKTSQS